MMRWVTPKDNVEVTWSISAHTRSIVEYYAKSTGRTEGEVVDLFLKNILATPPLRGI